MAREHEMFPGDMPYLIPGEVAYSIASCYARLGDGEKAIGIRRLSHQNAVLASQPSTTALSP
jgi:hypothetical protein